MEPLPHRLISDVMRCRRRVVPSVKKWFLFQTIPNIGWLRNIIFGVPKTESNTWYHATVVILLVNLNPKSCPKERVARAWDSKLKHKRMLYTFNI